MLPAPRFEILEHVRSHEKFDIGAPRMPSAARIPLPKTKYRPWRQGELLGFRDNVYGLLLHGPTLTCLTYGGLVAGLPNYDALSHRALLRGARLERARQWECVTDPDGADGRIPGHPHA
jgi:hypothetical protein